MANLRATFVLLAAAAILFSSCYASPATTKGRIADPKCTDMVRCSPSQCADYCYLIGLGSKKAFCTFHGLQFYCCCPVPFSSTADDAKTPVISS